MLVRCILVTVASLAAFAGGGCCSEGPERVSQTSFEGVRGRLWLERPCPELCTEWDPAEGFVVVHPVDADRPARIVQLAADGRFEVRLAPGSYAVELAVNGFRIDRSFKPIEIGNNQGLYIERTYDRWWSPRRFAVEFAADVSPSRRDEILTRYTVEGGSADWVYVLSPPGTHVELEAARLTTQYPDDVTRVDPMTFDCAAS